jgi:hypothetical protein
VAIAIASMKVVGDGIVGKPDVHRSAAEEITGRLAPLAAVGNEGELVGILREMARSGRQGDRLPGLIAADSLEQYQTEGDRKKKPQIPRAAQIAP